MPNPSPSNSDNIRTPIRQRTSIDPYLTASPYNRGHRTSRKYLCARCIDVQLLCCWISFNTKPLQASTNHTRNLVNFPTLIPWLGGHTLSSRLVWCSSTPSISSRRHSPKLKHLVGQEDLDPFTNKVHCSVDGLAQALAVAGHLRRRLPQEFQWVIEKNTPKDDVSDVFSDPSTSHSASQDTLSSGQRVPGPYISLGDPTTSWCGGTQGRGNNTGPGGKRKEAKAQTDCTANGGGRIPNSPDHCGSSSKCLWIPRETPRVMREVGKA